MTDTNPAGTWLAQVARTEATNEVGLHFTEDGVVFLYNGANGVGSWSVDGSGTLTFQIREPVFDGDGNFLVRVDIAQTGKVNGDRLQTEGESSVFGTDGIPLRKRPVTVTAKRKAA
jgi:hypothetical protein